MEKIKVNMNPNPLDVQTIHASQNDGEARQWGFELHNNGELIDTSDVKEQLVFKAYKGGTEQLLPENTSTPTTSPFLGDIRYPQGLLTDQEFTYRQSPTEEDGLAFVEKIKGNTLVWNQLVQNGNFADTSNWSSYNTLFTVSDNIATITATAQWGRISNANFEMVNAHKYLVISTIKGTTDIYIDTGIGNKYLTTNNQWETVSLIIEPTSTVNRSISIGDKRSSGWTPFYAKNIMCFDLTLMFGSGNEPTTIEDFTSLFPLPYYAYNQGTLLSFMGNGIKTVGKNLLDLKYSRPYHVGGTYVDSGITSIYDNQTIKVSGTATATTFVNLTFYSNVGDAQDFTNLANKRVKMSAVELPSGTAISIQYFRSDGTYRGVGVSLSSSQLSGEFTMPSDAVGLRSYLQVNNGTTVDFTLKVMLTFADAEQTFEPYTSSTTNLPTLTYFPNGMKSAGNVYDELLPTKAITRIGMVDLGTLNWYYNTDALSFSASLPDANRNNNNIICSKYPKTNLWQVDKTCRLLTIGNLVIFDSTYADATAFKTAMSGVYLYYELATESETSFTTASLVTENAEIPLSNNDGVLIGKCTEQLSENPGFIDAKIKLADGDGTCYSNKLQLHVERSPQ